MAKRSLSMLLAIVTLFSLAVPAFAEEAPAEEPIVTEEPIVEATEVPVVEVTEEPTVTEALVVTVEPAVTEEPVIEATEATEEPAVTETPVEATEEPEPTEAPESVDTEDELDPADVFAGAVGVCGAEGDGGNMTWALSSDGVLTISGQGKMRDYSYEHEAPWHDHCDKIIKVVINNGVTTVGVQAFEGCWALSDITLPNSVTSIGRSAFFMCDALTSITIPASVTSIDGSTFNASLTDIYVDSGNKNYTAVDGVLFNVNKTELICYPHGRTANSYAIPNTVKTIGYGAFANCDSLVSMTIPNSVTSIGSDAFAACPSLTSVTIGNSVTSIGSYAFYDCMSLTSVTIPNSVTSIGPYAFRSCNLTSLTIPNSVISIGQAAFAYCTSLGNVTILNPTCAIEEQDPEYPTFSNATIKGYTGSTAEAYAKQYGYKFESLDATPTPVPETPTPAPAKLATPKITKMENTASGLKVTWGKVKGADRYTVFYKLKGAKSWTKIGTTTATSYTRKAKDLTSGKTYVFTIRCVKNDKKTYTSDYDKTGKSLTYYAAPTVKISKVSAGIKVTWNKISGVSRYMVYYRENGGGWKKIGTTTATSYTRKAKDLKNGVTYEFTVRCVKNDKKTMLSSYKASNSLKYKK